MLVHTFIIIIQTNASSTSTARVAFIVTQSRDEHRSMHVHRNK